MASFRCPPFCLLVAFIALITATAAADDKLRECSLYPLAVGTEWVYAAGPLEIAERVTEHVVIGEEVCARLEASFNGQMTAVEYLTVREDGVYRVEADGQTIEPAFRVLKTPIEDGDSWEIDSDVSGDRVTGRFNVTLSEVTVPAGEFETIHVASEDFVLAQQNGTTLSMSFAADFAEGVGRVKHVVEIAGQEIVLELKELNLPAP